MEDYINFDERDLIEDLTSLLRESERQCGFFERCCIAWEYSHKKQAERLKSVEADCAMWRESYMKMAERLAETQARMAEIIIKLKKGHGNE